jgi:hypothetical protein
MKKTLAILGALVLCPLTLTTAWAMGHGHDDADLSTRRLSKAGLYEVTYAPEVTPIPMRTLHAWTVEVRARDGRPIDGATIRVDGGMPDHGHGLPTQPSVRDALGGGRYLVDGMKFSMGGYWVVDLAIDGAEGRDVVRFELKL